MDTKQARDDNSKERKEGKREKDAIGMICACLLLPWRGWTDTDCAYYKQEELVSEKMMMVRVRVRQQGIACHPHKGDQQHDT